MSDVRTDVEQEWNRRRRDLQAAIAKLDDLDDDDPGYEAAFDRLAATGQELLAFEETIPSRLAEPARRVSERLLKGAAWGHVGAAVVLVATIVPRWSSTSWGVAVVLMLVLAAVFGSQTVTATNQGQCRFASCLVIGASPLPIAAGVGLWPVQLMSAWVMAWALALFAIHIENLAEGAKR